ncbi:MarR family winged helix-turn-helix transcriptional regulator [Microbacterium luticocti]|uniref:MarR family winged helix-turn-helix transcriptional regulator n=1 Tax=Microbacterium luticocti TaxID=451764 RepID=UPI000414A2B4|nr:MarR family transcriptional regulator [Microbacterium luticocti]
MRMPSGPDPRETERMLDPRVIDPDRQLIDHAALGDADLAQTVRVLVGMSRWREAERALSARARTRMALNESDMEALRLLVAAKGESRLVTPGALAEHLGISTASTTKLLDRLEAAGHIERAPHPTDRRALVVRITDRTHERVRDEIGRTHAHRFEVAAALTPAERETVIRFLDALCAYPDAAQIPDATGAIPDATGSAIPDATGRAIPDGAQVTDTTGRTYPDGAETTDPAQLPDATGRANPDHAQTTDAAGRAAGGESPPASSPAAQ